MEDIRSQIVYEDNHLIAINKRAGQLVQPDDDFNEQSLEDFVKEYVRIKYKKPGEAYLGVMHRLDRPVSGLCMFARTSKALERMNKLFAERQVEKTYYALVHGKPENLEARLVHYLLKDTAKNISHAYNNDKRGGVRAELSYRVVRQGNGLSLLEVKPITGRPHQIRVQLSKIGHPIVGDLKYGSNKTNPDRSICLHAHSLVFIHPVQKERIKVEAPMGENHLIQLYLDQ
jgi:23S rRNA pseudouridine1911/1915/1917 synthase